MAVLAVAAACCALGGSLGPGPGEWNLADPASVGLSRAALAQATEQIGKEGSPLCLAVAKDGELVVDSQWGFGAGDRLIESYSAGKTMTAVLMGLARDKGLFDLDATLASVGVVPRANWSREGVDWWPNVTARHLLTQSSGVGSARPGTKFTYDSSEYIAHLAYLLNTTTTRAVNKTAKEWATEHFAKPLGIPSLYSNQRTDPGHEGDTPLVDPADIVCAGGDQPMTCSQFARVGQLILNKGKWLGENGTAVQMLSKEYVDMMFTPQNPGIPGEFLMSDQYSLLSYVMNQNPPQGSGFEGPACNNQTRGLLVVPGMPNGTLLALGAMSRFLLVIPSQGVVIASFGSNTAHSMLCSGHGYPTWSNEANPVLAALWRALGPALQPASDATSQARANPDATRQLRRASKPAKTSEAALAPPRAAVTSEGACYCYCPFGQGIGRCFDGLSNESACQEYELTRTVPQPNITSYCPSVSEFIDCQDPQVPCLSGIENMALNDADTTECPTPANQTLGLTAIRTCTYRPVGYHLCFWVPNATCSRSAFFPHKPSA